MPIASEREQFISETMAKVAAEGGDIIDVVQIIYRKKNREEAEKAWALMNRKLEAVKPKIVHREADMRGRKTGRGFSRPLRTKGRLSMCGALSQEAPGYGLRGDYSDEYMDERLTTDPEKVTCINCLSERGQSTTRRPLGLTRLTERRTITVDLFVNRDGTKQDEIDDALFEDVKARIEKIVGACRYAHLTGEVKVS